MSKTSKPKKFDFEGWATRYGVKCSDGETIAHGAFKDMDGKIVSLVDDHARGYSTYLDAVLGKALLQHRDEGVYAYITFNPSYKKAKLRRAQVEHGDIQKFSIKANALIRKAGEIVHGVINDLSIVAAGANPGAYIEPAVVEHGDGYAEALEDTAYICCDDDVSGETIEHSEDDERNVADVWATMSKDQKDVALFIAAAMLEGDDTVEHSDEEGISMLTEDDDSDEDEDDDSDEDEDDDSDEDEDDDSDEDEDDDFDEDEDDDFDEDEDDDFDEDEDDDSDEDEDDDSDEDDEPEEIKHSESGGKNNMAVKAKNFKLNDEVIEQSGDSEATYVAVSDFMETVRRTGTLKAACIEHGVTNVTDLYDQAVPVSPEPLIINSPQGWVKSVLGGVKKIPNTKIKSLWTDLSPFEGDHRALGYPVLGEQKVSEQIEILNRITECTWIYKRQTLDRDVLFQISSFNFLQWMQQEMGLMLNQELARAILIGDGRLSNSAYKIKEDKVRPIAFDSDVWTIPVNVSATATADDLLDELIDARSDYQGTGTPNLYVSGSQVGSWLTAKNSLGERLYKNTTEIAQLLRCGSIVEVPQIGVAQNAAGNNVKALMVSMSDYGLSLPTGAAALKDTRFDLDVNKETYLLEWLCGGAMITPKAAVCLTQTPAE